MAHNQEQAPQMPQVTVESPYSIDEVVLDYWGQYQVTVYRNGEYFCSASTRNPDELQAQVDHAIEQKARYEHEDLPDYFGGGDPDYEEGGLRATFEAEAREVAQRGPVEIIHEDDEAALIRAHCRKETRTGSPYMITDEDDARDAPAIEYTEWVDETGTPLSRDPRNPRFYMVPETPNHKLN